jgi:hypothetical protein
MKTIKFLLAIVPMLLIFSACNKDKEGRTDYSVRMTDAPGPYDAVWVDVQGVEIKAEGKSDVMLNIKPGIYNLLDLTNGKDTLIATGSLEAGTVSQIRLILGTNNTVVLNGTSYPLATPSADQSGLKIQVHQQLEAGVAYSVLLDFDANQSIVETGSNTYKLKPVIRTITTANSGSIKGHITPVGTNAVVTATKDGVSYSSYANAQGYFIISGLPAGTYTVDITPDAPFSITTKTNVVVQTGVTTDLGLIAF